MVMTTTLLRPALRLEKIGGGYEGMARRSNGMDVSSVGRLLPAGRRAQLALAQAGWVQWQPWRVSANVPERRACGFDWRRRKS